MEDLFDNDMEERFEKAFEIVMGKKWDEVVTADDDLYALEFVIMPMLADPNFWEDSLSRHAVLSDASMLQQICMDSGGFEILLDVIDPDYDVRDDLELYVYSFPCPIEAPFAYYGIMICSLTEMKYYTLELAADGGMFFCSPTPEVHENLGHYDQMDKEEFVQVAIDHFKTNVMKK